MSEELKVHYVRTGGLVCSDGTLYQFARYLWDNRKNASFVVVSNEMLILALRTLIFSGEIPHDKIIFEYTLSDGSNVLMSANKRGQLSNYPFGFCDLLDEMLMILMSDFLVGD